jgi:OPA family glycerol-3-phosphate transporter-like MFS transporter
VATPLTRAHRTWRVKVFVATWLSYVGYYFCRKNWNAAKAAIEAQNHWDPSTIGNIGAAYLFAYAVGQYMSSRLGVAFGARKLLLTGMAVSIAVNVSMGFSSSSSLFFGLMAANGIAQATGWSANVGTMANWFHKHERGKVMGLWSTNFTIGSLATGFIYAFVLGDLKAPFQHWQNTFYLGAAVLAVVWLQFYLFQRDTPEDVGLAGIDDPATAVDESKPEPAFITFTRDQWTNILLVGGFYFFAKLIRYAMWSWAAYVLQTKFHKSGEAANIYSIAFEVCGIPGVILSGWLTDRFFGSKRATVALIMTLGMCVTTGLLILFGDGSATAFTVLLGAVGFFLFGPDALLSGAGAMDIGSRRAALRATAIICTMGAVGPIVQEVIFPRIYDKTAGMTPVFAMLFLSAAAAAVFCALLVARNRRGGKGI